jgi:predicted metal-dependent HD superfamily phosphohydrolase
MRDRWRTFCKRFGLSQADTDAWFDVVDALHAAPTRAYHNLGHVGECLDLLALHRSSVANADAVEMALWLHDCVYVAGRSDNETRSAAIGTSMAKAIGMGERSSVRVGSLILATRHEATPSHADDAILLDIDLSILASGEARYDRYASQIREEHGFVKDREFAQARVKFLRGLLARPRIYHSSQLASSLEPKARANIAAEIRRLEAALEV